MVCRRCSKPKEYHWVVLSSAGPVSAYLVSEMLSQIGGHQCIEINVLLKNMERAAFIYLCYVKVHMEARL